MNSATPLPIVAGIQIPIDSQGRFNLNTLHRASGIGDHKRPSKWLSNTHVKELINAVNAQSPNSGLALEVHKGGNTPGTFANEILAVSYASWISPEFQIKVNQVFIDYRTGKLDKPMVPQSLPDALRLAADLAEQNERLKPKAEALDRISHSVGSMCITDAAKTLSVKPKHLFDWLHGHQWIYKKYARGNWHAMQSKIEAGYLEYKTLIVRRINGDDIATRSVYVTPRGLTNLATRNIGDTQ